MKQIFCIGGVSTNQDTLGGGTHNNGVMCLGERSASWDFNDDGTRRNVLAAAGTVKRMTYQSDAEANPGTDFRLTVRRNGSNTTTAVTLEPPTVINSTSAPASFSAGDLIDVQASSTGTPTFRKCSWSVGWEGGTDGEAIIGSYNCVPLSTLIGASAGTSYYYPILGSLSTTTTEANVLFYAPLAGTIKSFYVNSSRDLYNGTWSGNVTFSVVVNGTPDATSDVTFNDGDTTGNATGLSIAVAAGDTLSIEGLPSGTLGTIAGGTISFGIMYSPTTNGESMIGGGTNTDLGATTVYFSMNQVESATAGSATETLRDVISTGTFTLKDLRVYLATAPGTGESRTFTVRKNGANTDLSVTISGTSTSGLDNNSAHATTFSPEDKFTLSVADDNGSAAASDFRWSAVMYNVEIPSFTPQVIVI